MASLTLAAAAAYWNTLPNLLGFSGQDVLREKDFWFAATSGALALVSGVVAFGAARGESRAAHGSGVAAVVAWLGLTVALLAFWFSYTFFYALWLAPTQALSMVGVVRCFRARYVERSRERLDAKQEDQ